jgi:hypothetical protein
MARTLIDELRRVVLEQTTRIGTPVANIHGATRPLVTKITASVASTWRLLTLPGRAFESVEEFYRAAPRGVASSQLLTTTTGIVSAASATNEPTSFLFRGALTLAQPRNFPLAVDSGGSPSASYIIVLDGRVMKRGVGSTELVLHADAGTHVLEVLVTSRAAGLAVPADLEVTATAEALAAPVWKGVTTGYKDAQTGSTRVTLQWYADARAGGWIVFRRKQAVLSMISALGPLDSRGQFSVALTGNVAASVSLGADLYAGPELIGAVVDAQYDATTTLTNVRLQLAAGLTIPNEQWAARAASTTKFAEVTRLARATSGGAVEWNDTDVAFNDYYEYVLRAYGAVDASELSPYSDSRFVHAGDTTPPGPIVIASGYPTYVYYTMRVKFHTPVDADYAGVRVYYRKQIAGSVASATSTTLTASGTAFVAAAQVNWRVRITAGTGQGQERVVSANTTTQLTVDTPWQTTPDATSTYLVFLDVAVLTDYGLPNTDDSLVFQPVDVSRTGPLQLYQFRTFDKVGHEQSEFDCVTYTLDPSTTTISADTYDNVEITVVPASTNATQITVQVTATNPSGTPQVRLQALVGSSSVLAGAAVGTYVASGSTWTFSRPAALSQPAQATFQSLLAGTVSDADEFTIAEQGRDTVTLQCKARVTATSATDITVEVTATDPLNASAALTLTVDDIGTGAGVTPLSASGTGTIVQSYTVARPVFGTGTTRVVWKVVSPGRLADYDAIDVPPQDRDTLFLNCRIEQTAVTATTVTFRVTAPAPPGASGTPTVAVLAVNNCSVTSGAAVGVYQPQDGTSNVWVISRPAFGTGQAWVQFGAQLSGCVSDTDTISVPEQGRDTVALAVSTVVTAITPSSITVRVTVNDPYGITGITLATAIAGGTGNSISPTLPQTINSGDHVDYTIQRPAFGNGTARAVFTATVSGRQPDTDAVDVPEANRDTVALTMNVAVVATSTSSTTFRVQVIDPYGVGGITLSVATQGTGVGATPSVDQTPLSSGNSVDYVVTRGAFGAGAGKAAWVASASGRVSAYDSADVSEQQRDTITLGLTAVVIAVTDAYSRVRLTALDPVPQGASTLSLSYNAANCTVYDAGTLTTGATPVAMQTGDTKDYDVYRPAREAAAGARCSHS